MSSQGLIFFLLMIIAFVPKTSTTNSAVLQRGKSNAVAFLLLPLNEGVMYENMELVKIEDLILSSVFLGS